MKKGRILIVIGWILVALQVFSLYGSGHNGGLHFGGGLAGVFTAIGYFLFGIIGVILIIIGHRKAAK